MIQPSSLSRVLVLVAAFLVGGAASSRAQWPPSSVASVPVAFETGNQDSVQMVQDGNHGAVLVWEDARGATGYDIYAQRVRADGVEMWASGGIPICSSTGDQMHPVICREDSTGSYVIAWQDKRNGSWDIYAQSVQPDGLVRWAPEGVAVSTASGDQTYPQIVAPGTTYDAGSGDVVIAWQDFRNGVDWDIYAQMVTVDGLVGPDMSYYVGHYQWPADGLAISVAPGSQIRVRITGRTGGGVALAWQSNYAPAWDVFAQVVDHWGVIPSCAPGVGTNLSNTGSQYDSIRPELVSDDANGAVVTWQEVADDSDIRAERIDSCGVVQWGAPGAGGLIVCGEAGDQIFPKLVKEGTNGAIIGWTDHRGADYDVYAARVHGAGLMPWTVGGEVVCSETGDQLLTSMDRDCSQHGAFFGWADHRAVDYDIFAGRILGTGSIPTGWTNGIVVCRARRDQTSPRLIFNHARAAILAWTDNRRGLPALISDIAAQRIFCSGRVGPAEPTIVSVADVPNDQGGQIRLDWNASPLDLPGSNEISEYEVWSQVPASVAQQALQEGAVLLGAGENIRDQGRRYLRKGICPDAACADDIYWQYETSQVARGLPRYSVVVHTANDVIGTPSIADLTYLGVIARDAVNPTESYASLPGYGNSYDNLAPASPQAFQGKYLGSSTRLSWDPNQEPDLLEYRLYRGSDESFVPDPTTLLSAQPDTGYTDSDIGAWFYKLVAVDVHQNVSTVSTITPSDVTGAGVVDGPGLRLGLAVPNPARGSTRIGFELDRGGHVRLTIFDVAGRKVRTLLDETAGRGQHTAEWDGRDDRGRNVVDGLYFYRLDVDGVRLVRRLVIAR